MGLDILIYLDGLDTNKKEDLQVITALSASGKYDPEVLINRWYGARDDEVDDVVDDDDGAHDDADKDFDLSAIKWSLPSDNDTEALAELSRVMQANQDVAVNGASSDDDAATGKDFTPADREWI